MNTTIKVAPINGVARALLHPPKYPPFTYDSICRPSCPRASDSGRKKNTNNKFSNVKMTAATPGTQNPNTLSAPPMAGPMIKPTPNAAPNLPIPAALSSS